MNVRSKKMRINGGTSGTVAAGQFILRMAKWKNWDMKFMSLSIQFSVNCQLRIVIYIWNTCLVKT